MRQLSRPEEAIKVFFVCTANTERSRKAEEMFKGQEGLSVRSAGTHPLGDGKPLTRELVAWADMILVMEDEHRSYIAAHSPSGLPKVRVLGIQDEYSRKNPGLKRLLERKVRRILRASKSSISD
jgi:predicted protein tyrosine phosphatase